jgi:hypothetical protein
MTCVLCANMSNFELTWPSTVLSRSPDAIQLCPVELSYRAQFRSQMWSAELDRATPQGLPSMPNWSYSSFVARCWAMNLFETARHCEAAFGPKLEWTQWSEPTWTKTKTLNIEESDVGQAESAEVLPWNPEVPCQMREDLRNVGPRTWQFCNHWTFQTSQSGVIWILHIFRHHVIPSYPISFFWDSA